METTTATVERPTENRGPVGQAANLPPQRDGQAAGPPRTDSGGAKDRPWELRIWSGICPTGIFRELVRNRFQCSPTRIGMAMILSALSFMNFLLWLLQTVLYGRRIARTEIRQPPVFVLGHCARARRSCTSCWFPIRGTPIPTRSTASARTIFCSRRGCSPGGCGR